MRASWIKFLRRLRSRSQPASLDSLESPARADLQAPPRVDAADRKALVKARPASLEQRYIVLDRRDQADEIFLRLKERLYAAIDARSRGPTVFRESGRLAPGRPYFYLKAAGEKGLLCERNGAGWTLSRAEKIVDRNLFLREGDPIDAVDLYVAEDRATMPRVRSQHLGDGLLAMAVYEQKLRHQIGVFEPP